MFKDPLFLTKQGRKRPLDTPKKMIEREERKKGTRRDIERRERYREEGERGRSRER